MLALKSFTNSSVKYALLDKVFSPFAAVLDYVAGLTQSHRAAVRSTFIKIFTYYFNGSFAEYGKEVFREHNAGVRSMAPIGRYLEYRVQEGWEPLCKFLEVEVPEVGFPDGNGIAAARAKIQRLCAEELRGILRRSWPWLGGIMVLLGFYLAGQRGGYAVD